MTLHRMLVFAIILIVTFVQGSRADASEAELIPVDMNSPPNNIIIDVMYPDPFNMLVAAFLSFILPISLLLLYFGSLKRRAFVSVFLLCAFGLGCLVAWDDLKVALERRLTEVYIISSVFFSISLVICLVWLWARGWNASSETEPLPRGKRNHPGA